ncbi:MAG: tRNA (adenosine(37)-N6)-threonylcarbamoyltransferase complex dimerization subunit type 1 TsaB [Gordonia sp.]|uniref:tRNA (adenosine(37)-N6)-threonylcarbamoyltransferase complex dimerization subunit type 1 TsaB n=1 Tax=Williamsia sp. 1138 TaxID=1903117 RepID=UPI000A10A452|nr:tRNA (adenosine(37)-N6)-threonylcarbamoyltransferase complex dimerization subunit type 1 TsaB [Williamsia sp. 1138]MBA4022103.1 tRNA (adenosine(37)-N6)-threonylcarbamoyltransferase complex dimerization subunit type 1 TsaB [Gordonia sp. (in: high G+C Gram-positive bacteria)]OZG27053.1 tRNA (adenosine(37)-N6)-threonylcarbamoyltransferase complex dimerization subunit type 1 TsaB [Williamsia sp. 1138]
MLVLAIDTATPEIVAGVVEVTDDVAQAVRSERRELTTRGHAEILTTRILECLTEAGVTRADLDAVVVGQGPGPFTGLRVGLATGAAFADALGIPVHGVCSLDAIALQEPDTRSLLVVTDARRREVYWATYTDGVRTHGPDVLAPGELGEHLAGEKIDAVAGSPGHAALFDLPIRSASVPTALTLVQVALPNLVASVVPGPLTPLYLRRPDAVELKDRKK